MVDHLITLVGFAAVDSVNLLAFAVIAGLWVGTIGSRDTFLPKAARFTGGAFVGIVTLACLCVWVIGANQDTIRALLARMWVMAVLAVIGALLVVLGFRQNAEVEEDAVEAPLARTALQKVGIAATGFALGIIQSGTSFPFFAGMVVISFGDTPLWAQIVEVLFFALIAILPSVVLIVTLSKVRESRTAGAAAVVDRFLARGRVAGRWLTILVGLGVLGFAVVRMLQIGGVV